MTLHPVRTSLPRPARTAWAPHQHIAKTPRVRDTWTIRTQHSDRAAELGRLADACFRTVPHPVYPPIEVCPDGHRRLKCELAKSHLPKLCLADGPSMPLQTWGTLARHVSDTHLDDNPAILFRGLVATVQDFDLLVQGMGFTRGKFNCNAVQRNDVGGVQDVKVAPSSMLLAPHNECTNIPASPDKIIFCCTEPAEVGGETLLADNRLVTASIGQDVIDHFRAHGGVRYDTWYCTPQQRNDLPPSRLREIITTWQEVTGSDDPAQAVAHFAQEGLHTYWDIHGGLHTVYNADPCAMHPRSGASVWYNFAHTGGFPPILTITYGDGAPIEPGMLERINQARWENVAIGLPLLPGDVLLIDNRACMHGRLPYEGNQRRMFAAMTHN